MDAFTSNLVILLLKSPCLLVRWSVELKLDHSYTHHAYIVLHTCMYQGQGSGSWICSCTSYIFVSCTHPGGQKIYTSVPFTSRGTQFVAAHLILILALIVLTPNSIRFWSLIPTSCLTSTSCSTKDSLRCPRPLSVRNRPSWSFTPPPPDITRSTRTEV